MWATDTSIIEESFTVTCHNVSTELFAFEGNSGGKGGRKEEQRAKKGGKDIRKEARSLCCGLFLVFTNMHSNSL